MDLQKILEKESKNSHNIYMYVDMENDRCIAYEFSAYLLTRLFKALKLAEGVIPGTGIYFYVTRLPLRFIVDHFDGHNTSIGEEYIKVVLNNKKNCSKRRTEFDRKKREWNEIYRIIHSL